ncbi:MAG: hypothetical protein V3T70_05240 [Phycisphaerae bacterium]
MSTALDVQAVNDATAGSAGAPDRSPRTGQLIFLVQQPDPQRAWALRTLGRWLGVSVVPAASDGDVDVYVGHDAASARRARVWIRPETQNVRRALDQGRAVLAGRPDATRLAPTALRQAQEPICSTVPADQAAATPFGFDVLAAVAHLLTGGDARDVAERDPHGRLPDSHTWPVLAGLDAMPVCQMWAGLLADALRARGWVAERRPVWPDAKRWAAVLTHDVDLPQRYDSDGRLRKARALWSRRRPAAALRQCAAAGFAAARNALGQPDASWSFGDWMDFETSLGFRSTWAFLAITVDEPGASLHDARYRIASPRYRTLLRNMQARGFEAALHAGYDAALNTDAPAAQRRRLGRAAVASIQGVRHHFWRLSAEQPAITWRRHAAAGLEYDLSVSFTARPGFRCGSGLPFRPFDPQSGRELNFLVLPSTLMDAAVCRGRSFDDAVAAGIAHLETCRRYGLCAVLDWNVRAWNDSRDCRGFGEVARALYRWLAEQNDVWVATAGDVARHWRD